MGTIPVTVSGCLGRLGSRITLALSQAPELKLAALLSSPAAAGAGHPHPLVPGILVGADPGAALPLGGVWVEASLPAATLLHLELCAASGVPFLCAVTGFSPAQMQRLEQLSRQVPVLLSSNLSLGVTALLELCREAARGLDFDVEIVEMHHTAKRDAPSGTALSLAQGIAAARGESPAELVHGRSGSSGAREPAEIGIHALRGGNVVGEHRVIFAGPDERLELSHSAQSRDCFARGALPAVRFLHAAGPGLHHMSDVWRSALARR